MAEGLTEEGGLGKGFGAFSIIVSVVAGIAILLLGTWGAVSLYEKFSSYGPDIQLHDFNGPSWVMSTLGFFLGNNALQTLESLVLALAVVSILLFAFKDIIGGFSTFSEGTSWAIAIGLTLIACVSGTINFVVSLFALTASAGAVGIAIIILTAVFWAIVANLFFGRYLARRAVEREIEASKNSARKKGGKIAALVGMAEEATRD